MGYTGEGGKIFRANFCDEGDGLMRTHRNGRAALVAAALMAALLAGCHRAGYYGQQPIIVHHYGGGYGVVMALRL